MAFEFKLPDLGEGITEGEVVKWKVKEGDVVEEHQVLLDIETDKAIVEVPSPKKGKVSKISKKEGEVVNVGETLLEIEEAAAGEAPGEEPPEKPAVEKTVTEAPAPAPEEAPAPEREESFSIVGKVPEKQEVMASPKARSLAKKLGIDISSVSGTGPGGFVTDADVRAASGKAPAAGPAAPVEEKPAAAPPAEKWGPVERVPLKGLRRSIAKNLMTSKRMTAFVTGMDDADVTELWDLRVKERRAAKEKGIHLTFMPFFMKAVYHALTSHPMLNASMDEQAGEVMVKKYYNVGVAVMTPDGLMVSVVKDVDKKTILVLAAELQELSKKARDRKITLEELKGSTFTISNFGSFGGTYATPIINYPDVAILGTGKISERPWVKSGQIVIRKILPLSLTFDHRVVDGAEAAQFLNRVKNYLEDPGKIFIESA